ncbi:Uncharacterised protein [Mannheimia haemolytica]|uniref:Uncharacterized protein n=1 Tax=Mannheimia haemolytica TaxID=75985 RepID=A0A378N7M8_MANHA|nr:Uncharacterised protein [Mannheimia haemolytica]
MHIEDKIAWWLANGETGVSSKTMAFYLGYGIRPKIEGYPHDVSDFRRCFLLLETVPFCEIGLKKMAELGESLGCTCKRMAHIRGSLQRRGMSNKMPQNLC